LATLRAFTALVASANGLLKSIGLNVSTAAGNIRLGLYSTYSNNVLSGLLTQSGSVAAITGWNDLPVPSIPIVSGTPYYPAIQNDNGSIIWYYKASGTNLYCTESYGTFPDPTPTLSTNASAYTANMRITYADGLVGLYSSNPNVVKAAQFTYEKFRGQVLNLTVPLTAYPVYAVSGVTRYSSGNPLGSCTVELWRTADETKIYTTTSDPTAGTFAFPAFDKNSTQR
jgi:hypothetical protein